MILGGILQSHVSFQYNLHRHWIKNDCHIAFVVFFYNFRACEYISQQLPIVPTLQSLRRMPNIFI